MKRAIALLAIPALALLLYYAASRPASEEGDARGLGSRDRTEAVSPERAAPVEDLETAGAESASVASRVVPASPVEPVASVEEVWEGARSTWIRGRVERSGACASDDQITVFALARPASLRELERALVARGGSNDLVLSRRAVEQDGSFELPLPPDTRRTHVIALGRYLWMQSSRAVEVGPVQSLTLTPLCGGSIEGRVLAPGARSEPREAQLELSGRMEGAISLEAGYRRSARATGEGTFAIRGLPPGRGFWLSADEPELAPVRIEISPLVPGETRRVEVSLGPGASLRGRVLDPGGTPVAEAKVSLEVLKLLGGDFGRRSTSSDAEGRFHLKGIAAESISVHAERSGYLDSKPVVTQLAEGEERGGIELVLENGEAISGRLSWPDGGPAVDVLVRANVDLSQSLGMGGLGTSRGGEGEARTDATGNFRITGLSGTRFAVVARAAPSAEAAERHFAGLGLEQRAPSAWEEQQRRSRIFDADWVARVEGVRTGTTGLELVLSPPRGVFGRVVDEADQPVTSFRIRAVLFTDTQIGPMARDKQESGFEDELGRFHVSGLVDGHWNLYAIAQGFSLDSPATVLLPSQEQDPVLLRVRRAASVSGTVRSPHGEPVPSASVSVSDGPFWASEVSGAPRLPAVTTGSDGSYLLEGIAPGSVSLSATAEGYARAEGETLTLAPGQVLAGVDILLREGGTVTGEVYGADGQKASGRMVQAVRMQNFSVHMTESDARGEFRFEHLEPGNWQVQALPSRGQLATLAGEESEALKELVTEVQAALVDVVEGEASHVVLGKPPADPILVRGRVTEHGDPCSGAAIVFYSEGKSMMQKMRRGTTNADGGFEITLDGPGNYVAAVQRFSAQFDQQATVEFQVQVPAVREHELRIELPTGRIRGHLCAQGGAAVADERVTLYPAEPASTGSLWGGHYIETKSDEDGAFSLSGLRPGRYTVAVGGMVGGGMFGSSARYGRQAREVRLREDESVEGVDFRLTEAARARVRVLDAAGKPIAGAALFARDDTGQLLELFSVTSTDAKGVCEYGGLEPGRYSFSARKGGFASDETPLVRVQAEELTEVELVLQEGTYLWVKLLDNEGQGVQASISVLDQQGRQVGTMVALDEILEILGGQGFSMTERRIGPLPPGSYQVIATSRSGQEERRPVHLRRQAERRLTIHFRE